MWGGFLCGGPPNVQWTWVPSRAAMTFRAIHVEVDEVRVLTSRSCRYSQESWGIFLSTVNGGPGVGMP